jgi:hypothetical protein
MKKTIALAALVLLTAGTVGCAPKGPVEPIKSPRQIWIEAHPTHLGPNGECIEFDDEPCDADPFDTDDMTEYDKHGYSKKPSPRPMKTASQPKPSAKPRVTRR